jgi:hypothetical protein
MFMILAITTCTLVATTAVGWAWAIRQWRTPREAAAKCAECAQSERRRKAAVASEQMAMRQMSATSQQLREIAMHMHGAAEHIDRTGTVDAAVVEAASSKVFDIADHLHEFTVSSDREIMLNTEEIDLQFVLEDVIAALRASAPLARRNWVIAPDVSQAWLTGDERALRHVLWRTLIVAHCATARDSQIDIRLEHNWKTVDLVIDGLPHRPAPLWRLTDEEPPPPEQSRLALAKRLIEAHGGKLEIVARDNKGPLVNLSFPADRLSLSGPTGNGKPTAPRSQRQAYKIDDPRPLQADAA